MSSQVEVCQKTIDLQFSLPAHWPQYMHTFEHFILFPTNSYYIAFIKWHQEKPDFGS